MKLISAFIALFLILIGGFLPSRFFLWEILDGETGFVFAANEKDVVINEIAWMGTKANSSDEWIELYNNTNQAISLDGWGLYEAGGEILIEPLTGTIGAKSYYLIERTDETTISDISASQDPSSWGGSGLNNKGEHLQLLDQNSALIDEVNCSSGWFAGEAGPNYISMERISPIVSGSNPDNWANNNLITRNGWSAEDKDGKKYEINGTPKTENSVNIKAVESLSEEPPVEPEPTLEPEPQIEPELMPEPELEPRNEKPVQPLPNATSSAEQKELQAEPESRTEPESPLREEARSKPQPEPQSVAYPTGIVINEFLPSAEGSDETDEWIELKNLNEEEINLSQWKIRDTIGSVAVYVFPKETKIKPGGFLVLARPDTKITLNNSGDGLKLIQPDGNVSDEVDYGKAILGQSYNRMGEKWLWSSTLTPGAENIASVQVPTNEKAGSNEEKSGESVVSEKPRESQTETQLASAGSAASQFSEFSRPFLIAAALAACSGAAILFLKKKLNPQE